MVASSTCPHLRCFPILHYHYKSSLQRPYRDFFKPRFIIQDKLLVLNDTFTVHLATVREFGCIGRELAER